jgi:hypothetical protein
MGMRPGELNPLWPYSVWLWLDSTTSSNDAVPAAAVLGTSLDVAKRDAECIDLHFRTCGGQITKPDLLIVGLGYLAPTALRKIVRAIGDQGGVGERLISHAQKQCVSLPIDLVPILQQQCALDRIASEPEMVVAHRALRKQRLPGC